MPQRKKRIARNMGRIEFIACFPLIDELRRQGFDNRKIHGSLTEKGMITMAYSTLCYHMARFFKEESATAAPKQFPTASVVSSQRRAFSVNKTPSSNEMI